MCLYNKFVQNPRYKPNAKNGGIIPPVHDTRVLYVPIGCGNCMECRKQKANEWRTRMIEDIKTNSNAKFITLTFSDESILKIVNMNPTKSWVGLKNLTGYNLDNGIAKRALRLFNENYRKKTGKALRHWLITELGHKGTKNIHLHGIIWTDIKLDLVEKIWSYGTMWKGKELNNGTIENYVNAKTVNYIIKYVTKIDTENKTYVPIILSSPGIGSNYIKTSAARQNKYNGTKTQEHYRSSTGHKMNMPIYWRNKIYNDQEKEQLWINKLNKEERWVNKEKVDVSKGDEMYLNLRQKARKLNAELGYGTSGINEELKQYENHRRKIMQETRINKAKEKQRINEIRKLNEENNKSLNKNNNNNNKK